MACNFDDFKFASTYHVAGNVRDQIFDVDPEHSLLDIKDYFYVTEDFISRALKPQKFSFLHDVIEASFSSDIEWLERKIGKEEDFTALLDGYDISYLSEEKWSLVEDEEEKLYLDYLVKLVEAEVTPKIVNEVFTLLFADRALLLELGKVIAAEIKQLKTSEYPSLLIRDGLVKRCSYWPKWAINALIYRDKGRCAICLRDISGKYSVGSGYHVDHIVPLILGGSNDITNLQILCDKCNLAKSGTKIVTSDKYMLYW